MRDDRKTKKRLISELVELRQRVGELALESEERYRLLADNVTDVIWTGDMNLRTTYISPSITHQRGYAVEEAMAQTIHDMMPPDYAESMTRAFGEWLAVDEAEQGLPEGRRRVEVKLYCKDGSTIWAEVHGRWLRDSEGKIVGILGVTRDITERKRAEDELRESEERLNNFINSATEGIVVWDSNLDLVEINNVALEAFPEGTQREDIIGENIARIVPHIEESGRYDAYKKVVETGEPLFIEDLLPDPKFGDRHLCVRAFRVGEGLGLIGTDITERKRMEEELRNHREHLERLVEERTVELAALNKQLQQDITERKRSEEALRESEERLRSTIASMDDLVFLLDREGTFIDYYQPLKTADLYLPPEAFVGKSFKEVVPPDVATSLEAAVDRVMATGAVQRFDYSMRISGQERWFSATVSMREDVSGGFAGITAVVRDITDRKRSEEAARNDARRRRALTTRLAEVEEAERKRVVQELHDQIGQNLTALGINLSMMLPQVTDSETNSVHSRLTDCVALVEQTTEGIRNLMADLRPPVLDDYGLLAAVRWYGDQLTSRTGIAVIIEGEDLNPRLPPPVETSLFRIIQEALTNVVKHALVSQVTVAVQSKSETLRLTIADEGAGFDHSQLAGPHDRLGWGLMTMTERAEAMGARFFVNSRPGYGTQIVVEVDR